MMGARAMVIPRDIFIESQGLRHLNHALSANNLNGLLGGLLREGTVLTGVQSGLPLQPV